MVSSPTPPPTLLPVSPESKRLTRALPSIHSVAVANTTNISTSTSAEPKKQNRKRKSTTAPIINVDDVDENVNIIDDLYVSDYQTFSNELMERQMAEYDFKMECEMFLLDVRRQLQHIYATHWVSIVATLDPEKIDFLRVEFKRSIVVLMRMFGVNPNVRESQSQIGPASEPEAEMLKWFYHELHGVSNLMFQRPYQCFEEEALKHAYGLFALKIMDMPEMDASRKILVQQMIRTIIKCLE